jgi:hypothetical protein
LGEARRNERTPDSRATAEKSLERQRASRSQGRLA